MRVLTATEASIRIQICSWARGQKVSLENNFTCANILSPHTNPMRAALLQSSHSQIKKLRGKKTLNILTNHTASKG